MPQKEFPMFVWSFSDLSVSSGMVLFPVCKISSKYFSLYLLRITSLSRPLYHRYGQPSTLDGTVRSLGAKLMLTKRLICAVLLCLITRLSSPEFQSVLFLLSSVQSLYLKQPSCQVFEIHQNSCHPFLTFIFVYSNT